MQSTGSNLSESPLALPPKPEIGLPLWLLAELIGEARKLGFYTNLITSGIGLTEQKISDFKKAGLDHIQISFQASDEQVNNLLARCWLR